ATRRALLDSGPARVVRPVAERGLPALSLDLGERRGFVSKETKRKVSQFCVLDIGGLRCLRENRDAVVTRWRFRRVLYSRRDDPGSPEFVQRSERNFTLRENVDLRTVEKIWMKRNPTAKTKTEMFRSGLRHQPLHCRGGRVRNRSRDGSMKTSPAWFRAAPQFDCGRWKLRLELVPNGARSTTNHNGVRPV